LLLPGVFDALTATMAERSGFEGVYVTGAGIANTQLGVPDVGLVSFDTVLAQSMRIVAATAVPTIVDIDTGFGGPISVMHTVRALGAIGVAAVQIEDQVMPKRCGHFDGKALASTAEMQRRVAAAVDARVDDDFLVIARTDAIAVEGFTSAIRRAKAYREAGADVLFVEAPTSMEQIRAIPQELAGSPLLMNVVQGGRTPELTVEALGFLGYQVVLHANYVMRAMARAGLDALRFLRETGSTDDAVVPIVSWQQRQELVRLDDFDGLEKHLAETWVENR
jgi:2-methylisocitrate lyase-like PEP mutase family enzyme